MAWTLADIPDQRGRVAMVTGGNAGLGFEVARGLAMAGAHVVIAARDRAKAEAARQQLEEMSSDASADVEPLDLASLASVEACAAAILDRHERVDLLVNNAGVMAIPAHRSEDGFELQLAVNHLGHFVLTARLMPALLAAPAARVLSVTSTGRHFGRPLDPGDPHLTRRYAPWRAYGNAKLAAVHFAVELHRRLIAAGAPVASLVAHPGLSPTGLQAGSVEATGGGVSQRFFHVLAHTTGMPPRRAALPLLRAATDPRARGGQLYTPRFVNNGAAVRRPLMGRSLQREPARRLWDVSERETGVVFDVAALVAEHGR